MTLPVAKKCKMTKKSDIDDVINPSKMSDMPQNFLSDSNVSRWLCMQSFKSIYLHAKLFCGISILVPRYLFTLKSWPRSGNIVIPGPQWSYCTIYELKCLWLVMFWFQREFDRTKAWKLSQRVNNPLDRITLISLIYFRTPL